MRKTQTAVPPLLKRPVFWGIGIGHVAAMVLILMAGTYTGCGIKQAPPDNDAAITATVKAKLSAVFGPIEEKQDRQLERGADKQTISHISVKSVNGVVTLTGEVRGKRSKERAGEIARGVEHVVNVNNNLAISPGYSDDAVGQPN